MKTLPGTEWRSSNVVTAAEVPGLLVADMWRLLKRGMAQGQSASSENVTTWVLTHKQLITFWALIHKQVLSLRDCTWAALGLVGCCGWAGADLKT